jgi:hypothetical protein
MTDFITATDPIIGWEAITPTHRDPLYDLRQKRAAAWQMYYQAVDRGALDEVIECQAAQAEYYDAKYRKAYDELNGPDMEDPIEHHIFDGCRNCLFDRLNCAVCEGRG